MTGVDSCVLSIPTHAAPATRERRHARSCAWMRGRGIAVLALSLAVAACGADPAPVAGSPAAPMATAERAAGVEQPAGALRMIIDGREWNADSALFAAVHPPGYDRAVLIGGSLGPKDRNEQAFNLNLYGVDAPGLFHAVSGGAGASVAQLSNPAPGLYLAGGVLGYDLQVEVVDVATDPDRIEVRFSGTLTGNDGAHLQIRDGTFTYAEPPLR